MKICIPTKTKEGHSAEVFEHFGSAPYFTLCDTETGEVEVIDNGNQDHEHGLCQPLSAIADKGVNGVVTGGIGARAVQNLNAAGIKVYRAVPGTVQDMVGKFQAGKLEEITAANACAQHGRH
jgi:predicted Fe-Mo cluster-binding NifX family protein